MGWNGERFPAEAIRRAGRRVPPASRHRSVATASRLVVAGSLAGTPRLPSAASADLPVVLRVRIARIGHPVVHFLRRSCLTLRDLSFFLVRCPCTGHSG